MPTVNAVDFSIDRATGNIRHTGANTTHYTVLEFYEWLRDLGDDLVASGDDLFDITDPDIAEKSFETIIKLLGTTNIDQATSEYLYGGSIIQANGVIFDGITVIAPQSTAVDIIQNGVKINNFWGTSYNADPLKGVSHKFLVQTADVTGNIDNGRLLGQTRTWQKTYSEFLINGTARGENALPLTSSSDLNNKSSLTAINSLTGFIFNEGFQQENADGLGGTEDYFWKVTKGTNSINQAYEKVKHLTRKGSTTQVFGMNGELFRGITHSVVLSGTTGTFVTATAVNWGTGTTVGTGQVLAVNAAGTKMWIQHITGNTPNGTLTAGTATATTGTVADIPLSPVAIGASTGSALVGGYGVVLPATELTSSDVLTDLTGSNISPPNVQTGIVANLSQYDTVMVAPNDGSDNIDYAQFVVSGAVTSGATSITISTTIPSDTPSTGTIRVFDGTNYIRVAYTSWAGSTFTVTGADVTGAISNSANLFISYIDINVSAVGTKQTASYQASYSSDRSLVVVVRNSIDKIKTFNSPATFKASGMSVSALRLAD